MRNKEWYPQRFQAVIDALRHEYRFVQIGSAQDPHLNNAIDLRACTSIRETAAILYHARIYIGSVGFLMHLARSVECPSVIIYGGREAPWQSGYLSNVNLYSPEACAPCWRWNDCDFDRKCMSSINVNEVILAIEKALAVPRGPLEVETIEL
jgi:ADP-heptose:LPS heptosyltransferase